MQSENFSPSAVTRWAGFSSFLRWGVFCLLLSSQVAPDLLGSTIRFAIIGDYGVDNANELAVAGLVKTNFQPDFIVTTGDNNYGTPGQIDAMIGKYYSEYIGSYSGSYGPGASSNRFWPVIGNHDYKTNGYTAHVQYFTLPNNERYYDFAAGPVHFYMLNSDGNEPDGTTSNSVQALWASNRLATTTSPWKVVVLHHAPYSSSSSNPSQQWPFQAWGASVVVAGHAHNYERLIVNGRPNFVNGLGGAGLEGFGTPLPASQFRYSAYYGAMLVTADAYQISFKFYSAANGGQLIDSLTLTNFQPRLTITPSAGAMTRIAWTTNATGFVLESSSTSVVGQTWSPVTQTPFVQSNQYVVILAPLESTSYFRLRKF